VVILSKNDPVSGLRISARRERAGLKIERGVFTRGRSPYRTSMRCKANLFLSANEQDVMGALDARFPAARVLPESAQAGGRHAEKCASLRRRRGAVFGRGRARVPARRAGRVHAPRNRTRAGNRCRRAIQASARGPAPLQAAAGTDVPMRIRTALVTARSAPAHERAVRTLVDWTSPSTRRCSSVAGQGRIPQGLPARLLFRRPARPRRIGAPARRDRTRTHSASPTRARGVHEGNKI
jgi:5'-nucleotidase